MEIDDTDMEDHKEAVLQDIQSIVDNESGLEEINGTKYQNNDKGVISNNMDTDEMDLEGEDDNQQEDDDNDFVAVMLLNQPRL